MDPVIVVGAGISGVSCARVLSEAGLPVVVLDRGRRIGGRMGVRHLDGRPVDLGASYFTVSDDGFAAVVERWRSAGLARPWTDTFHVLAAGEEPTTKSGPVRWGSAGGLRTLVEDLADGLDVRHQAVERVTSADGALRVDGLAASSVVLAMPDEQARRLLDDAAAEVASLHRPSEPVIALVATYTERAWADTVDPAFDAAFVNGDEVLDFVADDGRRRGDGAPVLVAHSTPAFAAGHLADPPGAEPAMVAALARVLVLADGPSGTHVHRWSLAKPADPPREAPFLLSERMVGVCGDGWGPQSKVEGAWLSGAALGREVVDRLG